MSKNIFTEEDGNLQDIKDEIIAVIGYGNQGRAQALNMRDSGLQVIIGNRSDDYRKRAEKDGFKTYSIDEVVKLSDIVFLLIPDEIMKDVYSSFIKPNLKKGNAIVFASGYNIAFNIIDVSKEFDLLMIAPRMIGAGVRERFLTKEGFYSFVHVKNDSSGKASKRLLALCKAIGTLTKGAIDVTFKQEAVLDLFNEQGFGSVFGRVLLTSIFTLVDAGYPLEAVLIEMFMSEEMSYIYRKMAKIGLVKQVSLHSHTSQYGTMSRGIKFRKLPLKDKMKDILQNIESGNFAREWEKKSSKLKFRFIKFFSTRTRINMLEQKARKNLKLKTYDIFEEEPIIENPEELLQIQKELKEFEEFYQEY